MHEMIVAAFPDRSKADKAIEHLENKGYSEKDISVITRQSDTKDVRTVGESDQAADVGSAAVTGGTLGGVAGLLLAAAGIIIVGPIAAALGLAGVAGTVASGAVIGAVAGGLTAALTNLGIPAEQAKEYDRVVQEGGVILAIPVKDLDKDEIRRILEGNGAEGTSEIEMKH
ncbi:MAG TPA: general stress protein [Patescibacteria group bacterium]